MAVTGDGVAKAVMAGGSFAERLVCHARLPLIAGLDSARPAVHIWEVGPAGLREVDVVGAEVDAYPPESWKRHHLVPAVAWHPHEPRLMVTGSGGLRQWTPDGGTAMVAGTPAGAAYGHVAFSPDGSTVWAFPSSSGDDTDEYGKPAWASSDAFDPYTGVLRSNIAWDTTVVEHPGGGLVVALSSDQGATDVLFARPGDGVPARMHMVRNALILDVDGYEAPIFSADGRFLAIRGDAYGHSLSVFEFPTLHRVLRMTLGDPYPGYPAPPEWREKQATWSHHNIAFTHTGSLLVGTPRGSIVQIDLDAERAVEHQLSTAPVGALAVLCTGQLVLADRTGQLAVTAAPGDTRPGEPGDDQASARQRVEDFLAATTELPDDANLNTDLVRTDGLRTWDADDLNEVTTADDTDPTWLRLRAAINAHRDTSAEDA